MIALFAGTGALPGIISKALAARQQPYVICEMEGHPVSDGCGGEKKRFRIERLGSLLHELREDGVAAVCFAGAVRRPQIDPSVIDPATRPLVPVLMEAMTLGDDGALRGIIGLFEAQGFAVVAAHEIVPHLLPDPGLLTGAPPDQNVESSLEAALARHSEMSSGDVGQAVVAAGGNVVASEGPEGTDAMLAALAGPDPASRSKQERETRGGELPASGGVLFKAPKLGQERRADLPVIGPETIELAARSGIETVVIEAGGVMVLDQQEVVSRAEHHSMRVWVREASA